MAMNCPSFSSRILCKLISKNGTSYIVLVHRLRSLSCPLIMQLHEVSRYALDSKTELPCPSLWARSSSWLWTDQSFLQWAIKQFGTSSFTWHLSIKICFLQVLDFNGRYVEVGGTDRTLPWSCLSDLPSASMIYSHMFCIVFKLVNLFQRETGLFPIWIWHGYESQ